MNSLVHLKHFSEYSLIWIDIDDTLLQTTETLDKFAHIVNAGQRGEERWGPYWLDVIAKLERALVIPVHNKAPELIKMLGRKGRYISAARNVGCGRSNRAMALDCNIRFFDSDRDKREFLEGIIISTDLIIDDKPAILKDMGCDTLLVNKDFNPVDGRSIERLYNYWNEL